MNTAYMAKVSANILPLSKAGKVQEALKEWFFTEEICDHENAEETCELCDHEDIRYHFQIRNKNTEHELWVGSSCILRFKIAVYQNNVLLNEEQTKKKLNELTRKMQYDSCIRALEKVARTEGGDILVNALKYYKLHGYLSPKFAFIVFWKLDENKIDYHPSFFKIGLRRDQHKSDLKNMQTERVHKFWKALSPAQRRFAMKSGHAQPKIN